MTLPAALAVGALPFLAGDALKTAAVYTLGERLEVR